MMVCDTQVHPLGSLGFINHVPSHAFEVTGEVVAPVLNVGHAASPQASAVCESCVVKV